MNANPMHIYVLIIYLTYQEYPQVIGMVVRGRSKRKIYNKKDLVGKMEENQNTHKKDCFKFGSPKLNEMDVLKFSRYITDLERIINCSKSFLSEGLDNYLYVVIL